MEKQNNHIDRRGFLKIVGISAATTTAALYGCGSGLKAAKDGMPPLLFRQTR